MTGRLVLVREGFGEAGSLEKLVARVLHSRGHFPDPIRSFPESIRKAVTSETSAVQSVEIAARYSPDAVLVTADCDDLCPAEFAPSLASAIRARGFDFPVALVLFYREYETLAISIADSLDGQVLKSTAGTIITTMKFSGELPENPEQFRDAKGWLSRNLLDGQSYKPTLHQMPLTSRMGLDELRTAGLSSFRRLESAADFLAAELRAGTAGVYPPPLAS